MASEESCWKPATILRRFRLGVGRGTGYTGLVLEKFVMKIWLCVVALVLVSVGSHAQGTAFRYQGQLLAGGSAAQGNFDLRFTLADAATNGNVIGPINTVTNAAVNSGLFSVDLDFGQVFTGSNYWLSIGVRPGGTTDTFTVLSPSQQITPVPYAIFANTSSNLIGTLNAAQLSGPLASAQLTGNYLNTVNFTNGANSFSGHYFGNGLYVTNLNGSSIATGTVADARLSANVALLNTNQIFTGIDQFPGPNNSFNGLHSGNGGALTNLNGSQVAFGTVADARLSSNVPLLNTNQIFTGSNTFAGTNYFTGANIFTNRANSFIGSFFGNGLVGWIPVSGTSTQAMSDAGYILTNSQLTTVTLPASPIVGDIVRISGAGAGGWKVTPALGVTIMGNFSSYASSLWLPASAGYGYWSSISASASGQIMYATILSGGIYISTDSGQLWTQTTANNGPWQSVACSADGQQATAVTSGTGSGQIFYTTNAGVFWQQPSNPPAAHWGAVACSANGLNQVAVINPGKIYTSTNGGRGWGLQSSAPSLAWYTVASSADGTKLVAGAYPGGIYTSVNAGTNWTLQSSAPAGSNWVSVASSVDGSHLAGAVFGGGLYTSIDSGATWSLRGSAPRTNWLSVASSADGSRLAAVFGGGGIYTSVDGGVTWLRQVTAPTEVWSSIATSADGTKLAAVIYNTTGGGIYYSVSGTQSTTSTSTNASIAGPQGSAVELQYIGNNQWMPVSSVGQIWAN